MKCEAMTIKQEHPCHSRLSTPMRNAPALLLGCWLAAAVMAPGPAGGQTAKEFDKLSAQCWELIGASKYAEAERLAERLDRWARGPFANQSLALAAACEIRGELYRQQGRNKEAEPLLKRALQIGRKVLGDDHPGVLNNLDRLAILYYDQGRYSEAEPLHKQSLEMKRKHFGDEHPTVAESLQNLGCLYHAQARFALAETLHRQALDVFRNHFGAEHPHVALCLNNLAALYRTQGRYAESRLLSMQALEMQRKLLGDQHPHVALSLRNLGALNKDQGRYADAEGLYKEALVLYRMTLPADNLSVAGCLHDLACLYADEGRYADALPLFREALTMLRKAFGNEHPTVANSLGGLADLHRAQGQYSEAEPLFQEALAIERRFLGDEHPNVARTLTGLGGMRCLQQRYTEAEPLLRQALEIWRKTPGNEHVDVAHSLNNLAGVYEFQGRHADAEPLLKQSLEIRRKTFGDQHPDLAHSLNNLAKVYRAQGRFAESELLHQEAAGIVEQGGVDPQTVARIHRSVAERSWETDRPQEALAALKRAWQAIESQRIQVAGGDLERAKFLAQWTGLFELMVGWQHELGSAAETGETLEAMERCRTRALLDQLNAVGLDLLAGVPDVEAQQLRRCEAEAAGNEASFRKQLKVLPARKDVSDDQRAEERKRVLAALRDARAEYAAAYAAIRSASPAYRLAVGADLEPVALDELARYVNQQQALLLEYLLGTKGGYVLVVPAGGPRRVVALTIDEAHAKRLGVDAGPLTAKRISEVLRRDGGTGVLQRLRDPKMASEATDHLAALWEVLIPEAERKAILQGQWKRLVMVPDAALTLLPFETLVVEPGEEPQYLFDAGPPILYAPSATVLMNLAEREPASGERTRPAVLTVGDCRYDERAKVDETDVLAQLAPRSRYTSVGGRLAPLPYSAREIEWVAKVFGDQGASVAWLKDDEATEETVRYNVSERRIVHFACHGLVDQEYGNLFGALALTPGPKADDPKNDGFLTLAEIYELNLKGCELAILSACDTNYGPHQRGEGVWALSRGFLVAGARRVVASNWLVDDESAPSLMSYFCSILAKAEAAGEKPDYAEALWKAKRWLRSHEKWQSPYYWGTFVLIGPS